MELLPHELAEFYPMQDAARYAELVDGMRKSGYRNEFPIVIFEGKILDGRNRYRAAIEAGIEPYMVQFSGDDPIDFVIQANSNRRDLTKDQRGAIGLALVKYKNEQGKKNMVAGGKIGAEITNRGLVNSPNPVIPINARREAAALVGVSENTMRAVIQIEKEQPTLIEKIARGEMTVRQAQDIIKPHVSNNSGENEWYTPVQYIIAAKKVMGVIDIDPASSELANKTVQAKKFYTAQDNGLTKEWRGKLWMNPPYSSELIGKFVAKYSEHVGRDVSEGIVLVNNATETVWFQQLVSVSSAIVFPNSRIKFIDKFGNPSGAPLQGQAFIYSGKQVGFFLEVFRAFGWGATL